MVILALGFACRWIVSRRFAAKSPRKVIVICGPASKRRNPSPLPRQTRRRGRKPQGEHALTRAERQARYRQRRAHNRAASPLPPARPTRRVGRPQQWHAAVTTLLRLQTEYAAWLEALPDALCDNANGQALQACILSRDDNPRAHATAAA
jgi:hypothetical protein